MRLDHEGRGRWKCSRLRTYFVSPSNYATRYCTRYLLLTRSPSKLTADSHGQSNATFPVRQEGTSATFTIVACQCGVSTAFTKPYGSWFHSWEIVKDDDCSPDEKSCFHCYDGICNGHVRLRATTSGITTKSTTMRMYAVPFFSELNSRCSLFVS